MQYCLPFAILICFLYSCTDEAQRATDVLLLEQQQEFLLRDYGLGQEDYCTILEVCEDKSRPQIQRRARWYQKELEKVDSTCFRFIEYLNKIKLDILQEINPNYAKKVGKGRVLMYKFGNETGITPSIINFSKIRGNATIDLSKYQNHTERFLNVNRKKLSHFISKDYRMFHHQEDTHFNPFEAPNISIFSDKDDLRRKLESSIKKQVVYPDICEPLIQIYTLLSFRKKDLQKLFRKDLTWQEAMGTIMALEQKMVSARSKIAKMYSLNFGYCDFPFDKMLPVVVANNSYLEPGDTMEYAVFYAGIYNPVSSRLETNNGKVIRSDDGIKTVRTIVPNKAVFKLSGKLIIYNYSGIPRVIPWSETFHTHPKTNTTD